MNEINPVPRIGVAVIIENPISASLLQPQVLLGLRINKEGHGDGEWCFPGGKLDWMETIESCATRETKEESDLDITDISNVCFTNDFWSEANKHFLTVFVTGIIDENQTPKVCEPTKCQCWCWFNINEIPKNLMKGSDVALFHMYGSRFSQMDIVNSHKYK